MTRENYDYDSDWERNDLPPVDPDEEGAELIPPEILRAEVENVADAERDLGVKHPGQSPEQRDKRVDPDEWDH